MGNGKGRTGVAARMSLLFLDFMERVFEFLFDFVGFDEEEFFVFFFDYRVRVSIF